VKVEKTKIGMSVIVCHAKNDMTEIGHRV